MLTLLRLVLATFSTPASKSSAASAAVAKFVVACAEAQSPVLDAGFCATACQAATSAYHTLSTAAAYGSYTTAMQRS
ncbi:hypothetical protein VTL71DRAFT_3692 [Oculimacula yallundae]|uniref:Secreted protein n=1 Tax=Oculimacula yallundae TaxID=86028 RepID=A0ABR4C4F3_9HELO